MPSRSTSIASGILATMTGLALLSGLSTPSATGADKQPELPAYIQSVETPREQPWSQQPSSQQTGLVSAVVHLDMLPFAIVGRDWDHQQRVAYTQQMLAKQDALVSQIQAFGGKVVGRFTHATVGLAVSIDAGRTTDLARLGGVTAVRTISNYRLAQSGRTTPVASRAALQQVQLDGAGVDIAVIDTGVDYTHAKLGGPGTVAAYAQAYCGDPNVNPADIRPGCGQAYNLPFGTKRDVRFGDISYGRDPNGPRPKVVGGWDWVGEVWPNPDPRCADANGVPQPCLAYDANPIDYNGHGTHLADIIAGRESAPGANDQGVAPGANIWAFKACSAVAEVCDGVGLLLAIDDAFDLDDSDYGACVPGGSRPEDRFCLNYDPADVINLSLGSGYGQPEDDLTLFVNMASYYGSLVVAAAGNDGDKPYIVSSPSTAEAALSVGQINDVSAQLFRITAGDLALQGMRQVWSSPITADLAGSLQYGDGQGGNRDGCAAYTAAQSGRVLLVDRGSCSVSIKASNATRAGAVAVLVADTQASNTPSISSFGGGTVAVPALTLTLTEGNDLKRALATNAGLQTRISAESPVTLGRDIAASSSRGPRIADGAIKPDISAPGTSNSALARSGNGKAVFSGTSGSAPVVAGTAALIIQELERRGLITADPGLGEVCPPQPSGCPSGFNGRVTLAPFIKSLLMNTADPDLTIGGNFPAPITLQGSGQVDFHAAIRSRTGAWDVTELDSYLRSQIGDPPCAVSPVIEVLNFIFNRTNLPQCAINFPFGNDFFRAWNAQAGSISFGYDGVSSSQTETRLMVVANVSSAERTYNLSTSFRYKDDASKGVSIEVSPSRLTIPARSVALVEVKMTISASALRDWTLDAGRYGGSGTNITCSDPARCPSLQIFEVDGFVTIDGGEPNVIRVPWQVLPKRAADVSVSSVTDTAIRLRNPARYKTGDVDSFALLEVSPLNCRITQGGACQPYSPGMLPGSNQSPVDLREVGIRSYISPGINTEFQLPAPPAGAIADEVLAFGLTVYDTPYRASHNVPVKFEVHIDSNRDGVYDYIVFNADFNLGGQKDGRNAVFVKDINSADGTIPTRPYFFSDTNFNSQNWILPVPAAAVGVNSTQSFNFYVLAFDAYFGGSASYTGLWDCSPNPGQCGSAFHTFQTGQPKFVTENGSFQVEPRGAYTFAFSRSSQGATASPSQIGFLFLYRDAGVGRESDNVPLP